MKRSYISALLLVAVTLALHGCGGGGGGSDSSSPTTDAGGGDGAIPGTDSSIDPPPAPCQPSAPLPPADETRTLTHGFERTFHVRVPSGYDRSPTPIVFNFHGFLSNAGQQELFSEMTDKADAAGFIVIYAEGTGAPQSWNAGVCCGSAVTDGVDDVGFVSAMIDDIAADVCVDFQRIYATGLSNGGFLSHRLACELSDRIAAIGPVAGLMGIDPCTPTRAVPVIHFHGTGDLVVPYDGNAAMGFPSVAESIDGWVQRNGCDPTAVPTFMNGDSHCETYMGCTDGADVVLCTVEGGGHNWPGGMPIPFTGTTTMDLVANDAMWDFFVAHPLP